MFDDSAVFKSKDPRFMEPIQRTTAVDEKLGRELTPCTYGSAWYDSTWHYALRCGSAVDRRVDVNYTGTKYHMLHGMCKRRSLVHVARVVRSC